MGVSNLVKDLVLRKVVKYYPVATVHGALCGIAKLQVTVTINKHESVLIENILRIFTKGTLSVAIASRLGWLLVPVKSLKHHDIP